MFSAHQIWSYGLRAVAFIVGLIGVVLSVMTFVSFPSFIPHIPFFFEGGSGPIMSPVWLQVAFAGGLIALGMSISRSLRFHTYAVLFSLITVVSMILFHMGADNWGQQTILMSGGMFFPWCVIAATAYGMRRMKSQVVWKRMFLVASIAFGLPLIFMAVPDTCLPCVVLAISYVVYALIVSLLLAIAAVIAVWKYARTAWQLFLSAACIFLGVILYYGSVLSGVNDNTSFASLFFSQLMAVTLWSWITLLAAAGIAYVVARNEK
jgi:hypothetical protein